MSGSASDFKSDKSPPVKLNAPKMNVQISSFTEGLTRVTVVTTSMWFTEIIVLQ